MIIDAHMHFWTYEPDQYAWIDDSMRSLQKDFWPENIAATLQDNGVDGVIAVQACQTEADTEFLNQLAEKNDFIRGVVGWVDLRSNNLQERLDYFSKFRKVKGFRHVVQGEPPGFLLRDEFVRGIETLLDNNFTYDILVYHHQLDDVIGFLEILPGKKFIIDHCAKPDIAGGELDKWSDKIWAVAEHQLVHCKVSGLLTEAKWNDWDKETIYLYLDLIFEAFGPDRIMFGSDWPVMSLSGSYSQWKNMVQEFVKENCPESEADIFGNNAIKFYNLEI